MTHSLLRCWWKAMNTTSHERWRRHSSLSSTWSGSTRTLWDPVRRILPWNQACHILLDQVKLLGKLLELGFPTIVYIGIVNVVTSFNPLMLENRCNTHAAVPELTKNGSVGCFPFIDKIVNIFVTTYVLFGCYMLNIPHFQRIPAEVVKPSATASPSSATTLISSMPHLACYSVTRFLR